MDIDYGTSSFESGNEGRFAIEEYKGPSRSVLLDFILEHILGLDELLVPIFKYWDKRRKNIADIEEGKFTDALFTRVINSVNEPHYIIPSGSNFEGLCLPHLNSNIIRKTRTVSQFTETDEAWISDVDFMCVFTKLQVRDDVLNRNGSKRCMVYPSSSPGYVLLKVINPEELPWSDVIECLDGMFYLSAAKFIAMMNKRATVFCNELPGEIKSIICHGPALQISKLPSFVFDFNSISDSGKKVLEMCMFGEDIVWSLECVDWPSQAGDWEKRERCWPGDDVVAKIASGGCHLVPVPSKQSKPPVSELEWRLSFSKAEKTIAKLFTDIQRKVYLITKSLQYTHLKSFGVFSTYHLKTALFWHCERKENLHVWEGRRLGECFLSFIEHVISFLECKTWPHYFIPSNNLIGHVSQEDVNGALGVMRRIHGNPLLALKECHNVLMCGYLDDNRRSFDVLFDPLLTEITTTTMEIPPSAYYYCLWQIGNYYLLSQGLKQALYYYKLATLYSKEMDVETHVSTLERIEDFAFLCEDLDEAIAAAEERVLIMKSDVTVEVNEDSAHAMTDSESDDIEEITELPESENASSGAVASVGVNTEDISSGPPCFRAVNLSRYKIGFQESQEHGAIDTDSFVDASTSDFNEKQEPSKVLYELEDTVVEQIETERTLDVVLSKLGCMYQIKAAQEESESERSQLITKAEETFKEAIEMACSIRPHTEYGSFLLLQHRPAEAKHALCVGMEYSPTYKSYVYFQDIEKCILDTGVLNIVEEEGCIAIPASFYCLYLIIKSCIALNELENISVFLCQLEGETHELDNDDVGKFGALCLLKQAYLAVGDQEKADNLQALITALTTEESDEQEGASDERNKAKEYVEIDLSEMSSLAQYHFVDN